MTIPNDPGTELGREEKVLLELLQHSADQANHFRARRDQIVAAAIALTAILVIFAAGERETVGIVLLIAGVFAFFAVSQMHNHGQYHEKTCAGVRERLGHDYHAVAEIDRAARAGISGDQAFDRGYVLSFVAAAAPVSAGLILLATR